VWEIVDAAIRRHGASEPALDVHGLDRGLDEARAEQHGADGLRAMPQLQPAGAGLEEQRREDEKVFAADQSDLDTRAPAAQALQMTRHGHATEPAAQHHDPRHQRSSRTAGDSPGMGDSYRAPLHWHDMNRDRDVNPALMA